VTAVASQNQEWHKQSDKTARFFASFAAPFFSNKEKCEYDYFKKTFFLKVYFSFSKKKYIIFQKTIAFCCFFVYNIIA
jgi:hypothetical protein